MKLYAAADIHGAQYRLNIILAHIEAQQPDLVVICGDITQFGPGEVATNYLNQIPVETLAIRGNIDTPEVDQAIEASNAENLNGKRIEKNGIPFVGIGGDIPSLSKVVIADKKSTKPVEKAVDDQTVLVSHIPPYNTQDKVFLGHHIGSKDLRMLVDSCKPKLVLCAHVHEDPGITQVGETLVVNCSIGKRTEGAVINLNDKITAKILD